MNAKNAFEEFILANTHGSQLTDWHIHVIRVADTMYLCKLWFESQKVSYTARDLLGMAQTVLLREDAANAAAERENRMLDN
jgi:hypothetical protein